MKIDLRDKKILYELDKNSRQSNVSIAKKIKTSKEVVNYHINKLVNAGYVSKFYPVINTYRLGFNVYKVYIQFQNLTKEKEKEIIQYLVDHKLIHWIALCSGRWDAIIAIWVKDAYDFTKNFYENFLNKYSEFILSKAVTISLRTNQQSRRWFLPHSKQYQSSEIGLGFPSVKVDDADLKILRTIAPNCRLSIIDIAKKTNLASNIVRYRIKQLENKGLILHYKIGVDAKRYGLIVAKAFVYFNNHTIKREKELISYCKEEKKIINVVRCLGPWDFEIESEVEDFEIFNQLLKEIREKFPDLIKNYERVITVSEPKISFMI
mgnify:FL=1